MGIIYGIVFYSDRKSIRKLIDQIYKDYITIAILAISHPGVSSCQTKHGTFFPLFARFSLLNNSLHKTFNKSQLFHNNMIRYSFKYRIIITVGVLPKSLILKLMNSLGTEVIIYIIKRSS